MTIDPERFANEWCGAWNAHDVERLLSHFHEEVRFNSPMAAKLMPESEGRIKGKEQLTLYWSEGLRRVPDLHFTIEDISFGVNALVIRYRNQAGMVVSEVLIFDGDRVRLGYGTYPVAPRAAAGAKA